MVRAGIEICPRHLENNAGGCLTVIEDFRHKLERCDSDIAGRLAVCQAQARENVDLPGDSTPPRSKIGLLDGCRASAALPGCLQGDTAPLTAMLGHYCQSTVGG
jgi:hypothetical protein